ncbi:MAG: BMP family ABC transporter substrate-binding protein [bacterium]|nr:BMP family ABC transporter substrate-binding protein [bacterium]
MKRMILLLMFVALCGLACGSSSEGERGAQSDDNLKVGMVFDIGGKGDRSFNDSAYRGLIQAKEEFGITAVEFEPGQDSDREQGLRKLADRGFDLVIGVGFLFTESIRKVATDYPDIHFAIVDGRIEGMSNVASLTFREEEGCFLVGAQAALKSETGVIGFIGGMKGDLIKRFLTGYSAGALAVRPDIRILSNYAGLTPTAFSDPVKGKELALSQIGQGADVIFHASGTTGNGVIEAAREKGVLAIGVDSNQNHMAPGTMLTSMEKRVDRAVYTTIKRLVQGSFQGGFNEFGLETGHLGYSLDEHNRDLLTPRLCAVADSLAAEIAAGRITVPRK